MRGLLKYLPIPDHNARYLAALFVYWMVTFFAFRLAFLLVNLPIFSDVGLSLRGMLAALPLDASMAAWLCAFPWLVILIGSSFKIRLVPLKIRLISGMTLIITLIYALIATGEAAVYSEWKSKLNFKALSFLAQPSEFLAIADVSQILMMAGLWLAMAAIAIVAYLRWVQPVLQKKIPEASTSKLASFLMLAIYSLPLAFFVRGGTGRMPISMSSVYYSSNPAYNDLAVNPGWNMMFQLLNSWAVFGKGNPFEFMPIESARGIVREMHAGAPQEVALRSSLQTSILSSSRPNIVLLILESWSADMISSITKGPEEFTPEFHKLEKDGILFTRFHANGNRSQQGITSILMGFPALGLVTAADDLGFVARLPGLGKHLGKAGYDSAFIYGGRLDFGNITGVVMNAGFQKIKSGEENFPRDLQRGSMGVHDGEIVGEVISEADQLKEPFFLAQFTLSSHAPYDFPLADPQGTSKNLSKNLSEHLGEALYASSIRYTDAALGKFFAKAKTRPWYKNTLFVLVADHSHNSWRDLPSWHPEYRKIPLLLTGPAIKKEFRGTQNRTVGSQVDIPATILGQVGQTEQSGERTKTSHAAKEFEWSRDLLGNQKNQFAQYELNYGFGFVTSDGAIVYDKSSNRTMLSTVPDHSSRVATRMGMAYTQCTMQTFIDGQWCGAKPLF